MKNYKHQISLSECHTKVHCNNQQHKTRAAASTNQQNKQTSNLPPAQQKSGRSQSNQQQHQKKCPPKRDHRAYRATRRSNVTEERAVATQRNAAAPQIRAAACRPELRLLRRQRRQLPSPTTAAIWDYVLQCESDCCGRCSSSKLLSAVKTIFLRSVRACFRVLFSRKLNNINNQLGKKIETSSVTFALVIAR